MGVQPFHQKRAAIGRPNFRYLCKRREYTSFSVFLDDFDVFRRKSGFLHNDLGDLRHFRR